MEGPETHLNRAAISSSSDDNDDRDDDYSPQPGSINATPRARHLYGSSIVSEQKDKAALADPNDGKCLLTLQSTTVQACHLVPKCLRGSKLESLEWWWGLPYNSFHVDTHKNIVFLRADLHIHFDSNRWMLVPDLATIDLIVEMVQKKREKHRKPLEYATTQFSYRLIPLLPMEEVTITRIIHSATDPNLLQFSHHRYPFTNLGPLTSHAHPHFALYNAGAKIPPSTFYPADMLEIFRQCMQIATTEEAKKYVTKINNLYSLWTSNALPTFKQGYYESHSGGGASGREGSDPSYSDRHTRSSTSFHAGGSHSNTRSGQLNTQPNFGGHHFASLQYTDIPDLEKHKMDEGDNSIESDNEDDLLHDITASKKFVSAWWKQTSEIVTCNGGWDAAVCNDDQIGLYVKEHPRSPSQGWHPTWMRRGLADSHKPPPDTSKFSSNDWCLRDFFIRLPDPDNDNIKNNKVYE